MRTLTRHTRTRVAARPLGCSSRDVIRLHRGTPGLDDRPPRHRKEKKRKKNKNFFIPPLLPRGVARAVRSFDGDDGVRQRQRQRDRSGKSPGTGRGRNAEAYRRGAKRVKSRVCAPATLHCRSSLPIVARASPVCHAVAGLSGSTATTRTARGVREVPGLPPGFPSLAVTATHAEDAARLAFSHHSRVCVCLRSFRTTSRARGTRMAPRALRRTSNNRSYAGRAEARPRKQSLGT